MHELDLIEISREKALYLIVVVIKHCSDNILLYSFDCCNDRVRALQAVYWNFQMCKIK